MHVLFELSLHWSAQGSYRSHSQGTGPYRVEQDELHGRRSLKLSPYTVLRRFRPHFWGREVPCSVYSLCPYLRSFSRLCLPLRRLPIPARPNPLRQRRTPRPPQTQKSPRKFGPTKTYPNLPTESPLSEMQRKRTGTSQSLSPQGRPMPNMSYPSASSSRNCRNS